MTARKPDFVVIGAQKSASTFVQECLRDHPDIFMPFGETPYFESPDYEEAAPGTLEALCAGRAERRVGIKRPNYIGKAEVAPRIGADLPDARLIAVLRNPLDRIVAAYFHYIKEGLLPVRPLEEGLPDILDGGRVLESHPRARELVGFGMYGCHLGDYRAYLDRGQMLVLLHEDVARDSLGVVQQCYRFLDVADGHVPTNLNKRPQKVSYSLARLRFWRLRNRFRYRYNADRTRDTERRMDPASWLVVAAITAIDRYVLAALLPNERPQLSEGLRARLLGIYREDIQALETLIGRDLSDWTA